MNIACTCIDRASENCFHKSHDRRILFFLFNGSKFLVVGKNADASQLFELHVDDRLSGNTSIVVAAIDCLANATLLGNVWLDMIARHQFDFRYRFNIVRCNHGQVQRFAFDSNRGNDATACKRLRYQSNYLRILSGDIDFSVRHIKLSLESLAQLLARDYGLLN